MDLADDELDMILEALISQLPGTKLLVVLACSRFRKLLNGPYKTDTQTVVQSVALLQWARGLGCPLGKKTCSKAAQGGHLEVLQLRPSQPCAGA